MPVRFKFDNSMLSVWLLIHQTYNMVLKAEDAVFAQAGLTTQHHAVLMVIKYLEDPVTVTDVAHWLDRNSNSISMLLERMVKDGLVERIRDLPDRRSVRLVMTKKGEQILDKATVMGWRLVQEVLSRLSEEELRTLASLLEKVRGSAFQYLSPGEAIKEIKPEDEAGNMAQFLARLSEQRGLVESDQKRRGGRGKSR